MPWNGYDDWFAKIQREKMYFSDPDLMYAQQDPNFAHAMYQYKTDYNNATTPEGKALANANAERLRSGYSYRGGSAGDRYDPFGGSNQIPFTGTTDNWAGRMQGAAGRIFSYPDWQHSEGYNNALGNVLDYGPFEYDYSTDPLYSVYKKEYTREGQRAQQDSLAQAAVMTGGVPSSYAQTAAQQAGNYYTSQLADKIPELRAQAYGEYNQNFQNLLSQYDTAYRGDAFDYGVYGDNYQRLLDQFGLASGRYDTELGQADAAAAQLAALGDYTGYDNLYGGGYQAAYDAQRAREEALEAAQLAAKNGNYTLLEQYYGVPAGTFAKQYRGGDGGGSGGNASPLLDATWAKLGSEASQNPELARQYLNQYWDSLSDSQRNILARYGGVSAAELQQRGGASQIGQGAFSDYAAALEGYEANQTDGALAALANAGITSEGDAYDWLLKNGYKNAEAGKLSKYYADALKSAGGEATPNLDDAVAGLGAGMSEGDVKDLLEQQGFSSSQVTNGWKKYSDMYGYDEKKLGEYARLIASHYQNYGESNTVLDMIEEGKNNKRLSKNDLKFLLALLEGKADYIS